MADEIEAKYRVENHEDVRRRLKDVGGKHIGRVLEENAFFDRPGGMLRAADSGLRIRFTRPIDENNKPLEGATKSTITYKGPRKPGIYKSRQEIELKVDNASAASLILEEIGMTAMLIFEKRRESWELGGCKVELDELPYLGCFVEIEGAPEAIDEVAKELGVFNLPVEKEGYAAMLGEYGSTHQMDGRVDFPKKA